MSFLRDKGVVRDLQEWLTAATVGVDEGSGGVERAGMNIPKAPDAANVNVAPGWMAEAMGGGGGAGDGEEEAVIAPVGVWSEELQG